MKAVAESSGTRWTRVLVSQWYGEGAREVEIVSATCVWYYRGFEAVPIRYVLVRNLMGKFKTQALLSTDLELAPEQILEWFVRRWQIELTFASVTATSRRRNAGDNGRTRQLRGRAPCLLGLFSIITLCAEALSKQGKLELRKAGWYGKDAATFADAIASTRRLIWSSESFQTSVPRAKTIKVPRELFERLTETLCYAA